MRTSLNKIKAIEEYLLGGSTPVFEANLILDPELAQEVALQRETYTAIRQYGRDQLRAEIAHAQKVVTGSPEFMRYITRLFKKG